MTRTGFKPINALMRENEALKPIQDRLARISRIQHSFAETLPPGLNESCRVATVEGSTLVIAAANGAVAAKLKQMLPRLLVKFQENKKQEQQVTAISVVVQPSYFATDPGRRAPVPREPMPIGKLAELAESLEDSPLKRTVERIRKNRERALTARKGG